MGQAIHFHGSLLKCRPLWVRLIHPAEPYVCVCVCVCVCVYTGFLVALVVKNPLADAGE